MNLAEITRKNIINKYIKYEHNTLDVVFNASKITTNPKSILYFGKIVKVRDSISGDGQAFFEIELDNGQSFIIDMFDEIELKEV